MLQFVAERAAQYALVFDHARLRVRGALQNVGQHVGLREAPRAAATVFRVGPHRGVADEEQTMDLRLAVDDRAAPERIERAESIHDVVHRSRERRVDPAGRARDQTAERFERLRILHGFVQDRIVFPDRDGDREVAVVGRQHADRVVRRDDGGQSVQRRIRLAGLQPVLPREVDVAGLVVFVADVGAGFAQLLV